MNEIRVAAWQCRPLPLDVAGNLARLERTAERAAAQGAGLLVVPELFTTGYAVGAAAVAELAEPYDGPSAREVARIATAHGLAIAWGFAERDGEAVYNAAALVDADGSRLAHHRKAHLWGEVDRAQFSPAGRPPESFALRADGTRAGLLICYDVEFPEATRRLALQDARLFVVPTANPVGCEVVQDVLLRARAAENGCALVYANYSGADEALTYNGTSMVVGPDGAVLAVAGTDEEALLVADVPLDGHPAGSDYLRDRAAELYA